MAKKVLSDNEKLSLKYMKNKIANKISVATATSTDRAYISARTTKAPIQRMAFTGRTAQIKDKTRAAGTVLIFCINPIFVLITVSRASATANFTTGKINFSYLL